MRQHSKKAGVLTLIATLASLVPVTARAFIGTMPVFDWTAVVRISQQIGISRDTLNTLGLYVQQYNRVNAGTQEAVALARAKQLQHILHPSSRTDFPQFLP